MAISSIDFTTLPSFNVWEKAMTFSSENGMASEKYLYDFLGANWKDNNAADQAEIFNPNYLTAENVTQLSE